MYCFVLLAEGSYVFSLLQKALNALLEKRLFAARNDNVLGACAVCRARGIKLLNRHALRQGSIKTDVGYSEAALAYNVAYQILALKYSAGRDMVRLGVRRPAVVIAAAGANGRAVQLPHTFHAVALSHNI